MDTKINKIERCAFEFSGYFPENLGLSRNCQENFRIVQICLEMSGVFRKCLEFSKKKIWTFPDGSRNFWKCLELSWEIPKLDKPLEREGLKSCDFMDGRYQWELSFVKCSSFWTATLVKNHSNGYQNQQN